MTDRPRTSDGVTAFLLDGLFEGSLRVGERLDLDALAEKLGVSRGSVPCWSAIAVATNPWNSGCGRSGRDLNSGWNWLATNHGWSLSSTISTSRPSGDWPESSIPAPSSVWR